MNGNPHNGVLRSGGALPGRLTVALLSLAAVLAASLLIGYSASKFNIQGFLVLVAAAAVSAVVLKWPNWGLVLLLSLTSTVVAPEFLGYFVNPNLVYYSITLLSLLVVLGSLFARPDEAAGAGIFQRISASPVTIAMAVFMAILLIKAMVILIEKRFGGGSVGLMYSFNRSLVFYLLIIPVLLVFNTGKRQRWLVIVIFALASLIMARVLLELVYPQWSVFVTISVSAPLADETPSVDLSVQRLRAPGGTIVLAAFWIGYMNLILRHWSWRHLALFVPLTLVMLAGILLEFNRSYVIPMIGLMALSFFLNKKMVRVKLVTLAAVIMLGLMLVFSATGQLDQYVNAALVRYGSAFSDQALESQSVVSRGIEQTYAWQAIKGSPLLGIGLDELYRPPIPGMLDNLRWYIHNSYFWFWTYYGILGLGAFLAMMAAALLRSFFNWQKIHDPLLQATLVGCAFAVTTLLAANFAAPKFYEFATVPVVAVMLGLIEAIIIGSQRREGVG